MAWYAYCISEKQSFPELLRHRKPIPFESVAGIEGSQVFLYPASDLAVVVSEHSPAAGADLLDPANQRAAMDHARVIAECFKSSTVLPFRFGTVFADDEALRRSIRSNQRQFITNIEQLRGKAEMHLKVMLDDCCREQIHNPPPVTAVVGREYLSSLRENAALQRERQTKARAISVQMHRMFSPLAEEITCKRMETGKMLLDIAHLIDHKCIERYQNKYSSASLALKDCRMQLSGPWPPYHFVHQLTKSHAVAQHPHAAMACGADQDDLQAQQKGRKPPIRAFSGMAQRDLGTGWGAPGLASETWGGYESKQSWHKASHGWYRDGWYRERVGVPHPSRVVCG